MSASGYHPYPFLLRSLKKHSKSCIDLATEHANRYQHKTDFNFSQGSGLENSDWPWDQTLSRNRPNDVPDLAPFTSSFSAEGSTSVPPNAPASATPSSDGFLPPKRRRTQSCLDVAGFALSPTFSRQNSIDFPTGDSSSTTTSDSATPALQQVIPEATLDDTPFNPLSLRRRTNVELPEDSFTDHHIHGPDPFLSPSQLSPKSKIIMPPCSSSITDDSPGDKPMPKVETDSLGCAILPASDLVLTLESDCKFHYELWDAYKDTQFYFPVNLALLLEPSRVQKYGHYSLSSPTVTKIAARITSVPVPTRFSRLAPKPAPPPKTAEELESISIPPNQIYTTYYYGCILESPKQQTQKSDRNKTTEPSTTPSRGIYLSPSWERIVSKRIHPSTPTSGTGGLLFESNVEAKKQRELPAAERRGFILRAWIPVPLSLFENKETCTFRVDARVWVEDSYIRVENSRSLIPKPRRYRQELAPRWEVGDFGEENPSSGPNPDARILEAWETVTISHLQRGREMES